MTKLLYLSRKFMLSALLLNVSHHCYLALLAEKNLIGASPEQQML